MNEIRTDEKIEKINEAELLKGLDSGMKRHDKYNRQQLKLQCLEAAIRVSQKLNADGNNDRMNDKEIVTAAKEFYAFVRT